MNSTKESTLTGKDPKRKLIVLIPTYREFDKLSINEQIAITHNVEVLKSRDIYLSFPKGLDISGYPGTFQKLILDPKFCTYDGYNDLLVQSGFYAAFSRWYEYLAIVQPDVWVFEDRFDYFLEKFDKKKYDYIGAPWYGVDFCEDGTVGNGGFCIRRLSKFEKIYSTVKRKSGNEDLFVCTYELTASKFKKAPEKLALEFSFEENPLYCFLLNKKRLPMGTHAYAKREDRVNFWKKHNIPIYVYDLSDKVLKPVQEVKSQIKLSL